MSGNAQSMKNCAAKIKTAQGQLNTKYSGFKSGVSKANSAWNSELGDGFEDFAKKIQTNIQSLLNECSKLSSKYGSLANAVEAADKARERA